MTNTTVASIAGTLPLFDGILPDTLAELFKNCTIHEFKKGETIADRENNKENSLCLILDGKVRIYETSKTKPVLLNSMTAPEIIGMASLFGEKCDTTSVIAADSCRAVFISQKEVGELLRTNPDFAKNYIILLSDKIRFLNKKITAFTAGGSEKRLAEYLLSLPQKDGKVTLGCNLIKLSSSLDIGRASLYRAFDNLTKSRCIERNGNTVTLLAVDKLKNL